MKFKVSKKTAMCVRSIRGQLSDGMWENSPRMDRYWLFMDADSSTGIVEISDQKGFHDWEWHCRRGGQYKTLVWKENGFSGKSLEDVCIFLANKLRTIVKGFCNDNNLNMKDAWNRDNSLACAYLHGYEDGKLVEITIGDAYRAYKELRGIV